MAETPKTKSFRKQYNNLCKRRKINELSLSGIVSGAVLCAVGLYHTLCFEGGWLAVFYGISIIGAVLIVLGTFLPTILETPFKYLKKYTKFIGGFLLKIILIPFYLVMSFINIFTRKKYYGNFGFYKWDDNSNITCEFSEYSNTKSKKHKYVTLGIAEDVFMTLYKNKTFILIPLVAVLLALGFVFFFASSNAVFSFVYTLF